MGEAIGGAATGDVPLLHPVPRRRPPDVGLALHVPAGTEQRPHLFPQPQCCRDAWTEVSRRRRRLHRHPSLLSVLMLFFVSFFC